MDMIFTLDQYREMSPKTWRGFETPQLGKHIHAYRTGLLKETQDSLPSKIRTAPGQVTGTANLNKSRISLAVYSRINADTQTYPPLGKDSMALTKAMAKDETFEKSDRLLCTNLANLAEKRIRETRRNSKEVVA